MRKQAIEEQARVEASQVRDSDPAHRTESQINRLPLPIHESSDSRAERTPEKFEICSAAEMMLSSVEVADMGHYSRYAADSALVRNSHFV